MPDTPTLTATDVRRWRDVVTGGARPSGSGVEADAARLDLISELEGLKAAACALQADLAVDLRRSTRQREADAGVPAARRGRGVAGQLGLARQVSPHRAQVLLGLAHDLATDLGETRAALAAGRIDEHSAMVVARETGCLDRAQRAEVDEAVLGLDEHGRSVADGLGPRELAAEVRRRVAAADPAAVARRHRRAVSERCVTLRPAPDTMTYLTALVPTAQGVACFAALGREADALRATTEAGTKGRGQVMADLLVEHLTGQATAEAVPVTVDLVISDQALLAGGHEPAEVAGWGPVPAQIARELVAAALDAPSVSYLRRLYADPTGHLVALSTRARLAGHGLADYLRLRDRGICRTPWCEAPIRHVDHVVPVAEGGPTSVANTQGLCQACNHVKQAPGWHHETVVDPVGHRHTVQTRTPTGHRHRSRAPALPEPARPPDPATTSRLEPAFTRFVLDHAA